MFKTFIYLSIILGIAVSQNINQETGWSYVQSTDQAFYVFESIEINGQVVIGDGATVQDEDESYCFQNSNSCDVVGAFFNGECIGWVYADSAGYTTVPAMGSLENYAENGSLINFKIYDSSEDDYIDFDSDSMVCLDQNLETISCLWENFKIVIISSPDFLDNDEIPSSFNLLSAYPNPFNPSINIDFHIESNSLVNLKIYDMLGSLVDTLVSNDFMVTGSHSAIWSPGNNISAGEYIVSLSVDGNQLATQKITYIK